MDYIKIFFCVITKEELYEQKQQVMDYVIHCFKKEKVRIKNKVEKNYFIEIEKELNLFHRDFIELTNKEFKKWIKRFFEVIFILEDDFYSFLHLFLFQTPIIYRYFYK